MRELRFENHDSDAIKEFYNLNKHLVKKRLKNALIDAYECMDYVEKYKWHDLKKNPDDLPIGQNEEYVLIVRKDSTFTLNEIGWIRDFKKEIIAWKYIEPVEEGIVYKKVGRKWDPVAYLEKKNIVKDVL